MKRATVTLSLPGDLILPLLGVIGFLIGDLLDGSLSDRFAAGAVAFAGGQLVLLGILWSRRDRSSEVAP